MSEFDEKLNALLSDPDRMAQIMQMAQSLSGAAAPPPPAPPTTRPETNPAPPVGTDFLSSLTGGIDPQLLTRLLPLARELGSDSGSGARALLYALRPYLKQERQERVERALQLAKLLHIGRKVLTNLEG